MLNVLDSVSRYGLANPNSKLIKSHPEPLYYIEKSKTYKKFITSIKFSNGDFLKLVLAPNYFILKDKEGEKIIQRSNVMRNYDKIAKEIVSLFNSLSQDKTCYSASEVRRFKTSYNDFLNRFSKCFVTELDEYCDYDAEDLEILTLLGLGLISFPIFIILIIIFFVI